MWEYCTKRWRGLKQPPHQEHVFYDIPGQMKMISTSQLYALTCVESVFRAKGIKDLYEPKEESKASTCYLRRLQKVWKGALVSKIPMPEPFNMERYPIIYKPSDLPWMAYRVNASVALGLRI